MNWLMNFRVNLRCWSWRGMGLSTYIGMRVGAYGWWARCFAVCSVSYRSLSSCRNFLSNCYQKQKNLVDLFLSISTILTHKVNPRQDILTVPSL